jgi:threonine dehydratase
MSNITMIREARERLDGAVRRTPMLSSPFLDEIAGRRVFVKAECLQHTGSFKFRGGWSALSGLTPEDRKRGVIAYSSGNHAQGVTHAAQLHGVPSVIIMPKDAPALKIANTKALGAEVVLYDRYSEDRESLGSRIASERGLTLIRPYDEPLVIAGQGTTGLEIAEQAEENDVTKADVLVCCGGGGLTSGIAVALADTMPDLRVRPVEPEGFDDVFRSLESGLPETNDPKNRSICDAIVTNAPGEITFPLLKEHCGRGLVISDNEALKTVAHAFLRLKLILEPGGAVALAAALFRKNEIEGDAVIVVATGGNIDPAMFAKALATLS